MNYQELLQQMLGVIEVAVLLVGCGAPVAIPGSNVPTATSTPVLPAVTPPRRMGDSEQNMSPTPEFDTIEIESEEQQLSDGPKLNKQTNCPNLESTLFQITQSSDPLTLAEQLQLTIKDDKIQVLLILASEDTNFLQNFEVEIGTQVGVQVQAFVPVNQLCNLANTPEVLAIRLPAAAIPQK